MALVVNGPHDIEGFVTWRVEQISGIWVSFVYQLCVRAESRRMRLGKWLLDQVGAYSAPEGARGIVLQCANSNSRGQRFYERYGFEPCGLEEPLKGFMLLERMWHTDDGSDYDSHAYEIGHNLLHRAYERLI